MWVGSVIYKHKSKNTVPPTDLLHWRPRFLASAVYGSAKLSFSCFLNEFILHSKEDYC